MFSFLLPFFSTYYSNFTFYIKFNIVTFILILLCHGIFFYQKTNVKKEKLISHFSTCAYSFYFFNMSYAKKVQIVYVPLSVIVYVSLIWITSINKNEYLLNDF